VQELSSYDFESAEARQRFEQMVERLKDQLMQQFVDQLSGSMQQMTPEDMARMKDMLSELNQMIERRERGEDPRFEEFMGKYGDFFPENPQSLDELLEIMAQRMQAMQALMNSMTPEQRAQLQQLSEQLLEDMDLQFQAQQLGQHLQSMYPAQGWNKQYDFDGSQQMDMGQALQSMQQMGPTWPEFESFSGTTRHARSSVWPSSPNCWKTPGSSTELKVALS